MTTRQPDEALLARQRIEQRLGGFPRYELIVGAGGRQELYDLESDPLQKRNLAQEMPDRVTELRRGLDRVQLALEALHRGQALDLAPEVLESLKEFGYVGGDQ